MRAEERLDYILQATKDSGFASITEIAAELGVSKETVRRDIRILCGQNKLRSTRGGAVPIKMQLRRDASYMMRKHANEQAKHHIGKKAAGLISDGDVVFITPGVSTEAVAEAVLGVSNVTFVTSSLPIAAILVEKCSRREFSGHVIIIGGEIDISNRYILSAASLENMDRFHYDIAFFSCTAISSNEVYASFLDEGCADEHLLRHTDKAILIAESDKFGKNSVYRFAAISDFSHIITDTLHRIPDYILEQIEAADVEFLTADT